MNGYIEICIDGLKTKVEFSTEDGITGPELMEYFIGFLKTQTFCIRTIKDSLESSLEGLSEELKNA